MSNERKILEVLLNIEKILEYSKPKPVKKRKPITPIVTDMGIILPEMAKVLAEFNGECSLNRMAIRITECIGESKSKLSTIRNLIKLWLKDGFIYEGVKIQLINKAKPTKGGAGVCLYWITGTKMSAGSKNASGYLVQDTYSNDSTAEENDVFS